LTIDVAFFYLNPVPSFREIISDLIYLLYPEICYACDTEPPAKNQIFCTSCLYELPFTDHFENQENELLFHFAGRHKVSFGAALLYLHKKGMVHRMMNNLKYKKHRDIAEVLGNYFGKALLETEFVGELHYIVPVPIHYKKMKKRGFNQSELFANGISEVIKIPVMSDNLVKSKETSSQTGLNRTQRLENVHSTIEIKKPDMLHGKHILLVDDIITTGATLESCMMSLAEARDIKVAVGTMAITI
jgi:ComF family protein